MTKLISKISRIDEIQKIMFGVLVIAVLIIGSLYIYFVSTTILSIVDKNNNIKVFQNLNIEYQQLEEHYFRLLSGLDEEYAASLGFVEQDNIDYIKRQTTVARNY